MSPADGGSSRASLPAESWSGKAGLGLSQLRRILREGDGSSDTRETVPTRRCVDVLRGPPRVMRNPTAKRSLEKGRTTCWYDATESVVIHDPSHLDGGTVFRPDDGRMYFDITLE